MSTPKFNLTKNGKVIQSGLTYKEADKIVQQEDKEDRKGLAISRAAISKDQAAAEKAAAEKAAAEKAAAEKAAAEKGKGKAK